MPKNTKITPHCCPEAEEHKTVYLEFSYDDLESGAWHDKEPDWVTLGFDTETGKTYPVVVNCCPHCGKDLPDIRRRRGRAKVCDPDIRSKSCGTCDSSLMSCQCQPPEYAFEPAHLRGPHAMEHR